MNIGVSLELQRKTMVSILIYRYGQWYQSGLCGYENISISKDLNILEFVLVMVFRYDCGVNNNLQV